MLSEDKLIKTKKQLKEYIEFESYGYKLDSFRHITAYVFQISERAILLRHTRLLRKTEYYTNTGRKLLATLYTARLLRLQSLYGLRVPINAFDKGMRIYHVLPVAMNDKAVFGENCRILPDVMVGGDDYYDRAPRIGNNVTLGLGSKIFGDIELADDIYVGAGAIVNKSFTERGIAVAGVPARKIGMSPLYLKKLEEEQATNTGSEA